MIVLLHLDGYQTSKRGSRVVRLGLRLLQVPVSPDRVLSFSQVGLLLVCGRLEVSRHAIDSSMTHCYQFHEGGEHYTIAIFPKPSGFAGSHLTYVLDFWVCLM